MPSSPLIVVSVGAATDPQPYVRAVEQAGGQAVVMVPNGGAQPLPAQAAGIIFCGGAAVHPSRFGQELDLNIRKAVDEPRDAMEWALLGESLERRLPILGICRGFQMINVYLGGTLSQNLAAQGWQDNHRPDGARDLLAHGVVAKGGLLGSVYGDDPFEVNSIHRQGISILAAPLTPVVHTADGLVEGFESSDLNIVGVQWHPEELITEIPHQKLFSALICDMSWQWGTPS
ncbi:glutamine amidotransferase [Devosia yakushimensis]|uniref:Glutamine amidotransferase n=1 Tax=Devosia yakushimensis TaxID=470028 RepID=A0ABQ5U9R7_9HYPH|nr:gamma-glutamyl-gamma-aminobutyrate hydrolase family protein [Devosia yakushimensis]GLQ08166.1 glutamine amidotransferase [Devosia yakushimensis]